MTQSCRDFSVTGRPAGEPGCGRPEPPRGAGDIYFHFQGTRSSGGGERGPLPQRSRAHYVARASGGQITYPYVKPVVAASGHCDMTLALALASTTARLKVWLTLFACRIRLGLRPRHLL